MRIRKRKMMECQTTLMISNYIEITCKSQAKISIDGLYETEKIIVEFKDRKYEITIKKFDESLKE